MFFEKIYPVKKNEIWFDALLEESFCLGMGIC